MAEEREQLVWPVGPRASEKSPQGLETPVVLPATSLLHHRARVLDPTIAPQPGGTRRRSDLARLGRSEEPTVDYAPTVYVTNQILVSLGQSVDQVEPLVEELSRRLPSVGLQPDRSDLSLLRDRAQTRFPAVLRIGLVAESDEAGPPPDAWLAVQQLRDALADPEFGAGRDDNGALRRRVEEGEIQVGLNHLVFAAQVGGVGFSIGHSAGGVGFSIGHGFSVGHSTGPSEYAVPGLGGRSPVRLVGRPPVRTDVARRPVVAVLDTGVAAHPWFDAAPTGDPIVERLVYDPATRSVGAATGTDGGEPDPNLFDPLEGLQDPYFGHGTFIAGLIHQTCPDARICSIKMMGNDGIVTEDALLDGLAYLHGRQAAARRSADAGQLVDVVSLSLGYYHESDLDAEVYDTKLKSALDALAEEGVLVVAAAGNNATTRPLLPAGFCAYGGGVLTAPADRVPMVSVGALNPDGSVALFSNAGPWVACHSPGAALVSTLPVADVGQRSGVDLGSGDGADVGTWRATLDPDSFTGFGTWSGTSFAAPVMAASAAQALLDGPLGARGDDQVGRAREALSSLGFDIGSG